MSEFELNVVLQQIAQELDHETMVIAFTVMCVSWFILKYSFLGIKASARRFAEKRDSSPYRVSHLRFRIQNVAILALGWIGWFAIISTHKNYPLGLAFFAASFAIYICHYLFMPREAKPEPSWKQAN